MSGKSHVLAPILHLPKPLHTQESAEPPRGEQVLLPGLEVLVAILLGAHLLRDWRWCPKSPQKGLLPAKSHFPVVQRIQEVLCPSSWAEGKAEPPKGPVCLASLPSLQLSVAVTRAVYTCVYA